MFNVFRTGHFESCSLNHDQSSSYCSCTLRGYGYAFGIALFLALFELWGSFQSLSFALLGDAWHVFSDMIIYGVSIYAERLKFKGNSEAHIEQIDRRWGIRNASILQSVAVINMTLGIVRLATPYQHVHSDELLFYASVGLAVNVVMVGLLWSLGIDHGHDHGDHDHAHGDHNHAHHSHEGRSFILSGAMWHTLGDLSVSIVVVAAATIMVGGFLPELEAGQIDSVATIVVSIVLILVAQHLKNHARH